MNKKKIALIVLSAVVAAFALLVAYLSFAENPLFFSGKSELEVISGNWPPPQMPPAPNVPPKILSGSTTGVVKEVRIDKKEILAELNMPTITRKDETTPLNFPKSREMILVVNENSLLYYGPATSKAIKLSDIKAGNGILLKYSGDLFNSQTTKLDVVSLNVFDKIN